MAKGKMTHQPWKIIHHESTDVIELVLDSPEGTERMWLYYEEVAKLKELLGVLKTPVK